MDEAAGLRAIKLRLGNYVEVSRRLANHVALVARDGWATARRYCEYGFQFGCCEVNNLRHLPWVLPKPSICPGGGGRVANTVGEASGGSGSPALETTGNGNTSMSILTDLLSGKITFSTAETEIGAWFSKLTASNSAVSQATSTLMTDLKQAASDAITVGESAIGPIITDGATALETLLENLFAKATGGLSIVANPLINSGIDTIANTLKNAIDAWATAKKASLVPAPATPAAPVSLAEVDNDLSLNAG